METFEILQIDMDVSGGPSKKLTEWIAKLKQQFAILSTRYTKAFSNLKVNAKNALASVLKLFKGVSSGKHVRGAQTSLKRTVAAFDQLNRLVKKSGGSAGLVIKENSNLITTAANLIQKARQAGAAVQEHILQPLAQWPQLGFRVGLQNIGQHIGALLGITVEGNQKVNLFAQAWENLGLKTSFWKDLVTRTNTATAAFRTQMEKSGLAAQGVGNQLSLLGMQLSGNADGWGKILTASDKAWTGISGTWNTVSSWFGNKVTKPIELNFSDLFTGISNLASNAWESTQTVFSDLSGYFSRVFSEAWGKVASSFSNGGASFNAVQSGVLEGFKKMANGIIGGLNAVAIQPFSGLNTVLDKLQNLKIGNLKPFSFLTWRITTPQVPYLAKGAVLPANKPFLAMVGDQRHGTNVEAPLSTIQEAVALTMEDFMQGNMAGHNATVEVLKQLLSAVMGITVGDEVIGAACDRHHQKMAILNGK